MPLVDNDNNHNNNNMRSERNIWRASEMADIESDEFVTFACVCMMCMCMHIAVTRVGTVQHGIYGTPNDYMHRIVDSDRHMNIYIAYQRWKIVHIRINYIYPMSRYPIMFTLIDCMNVMIDNDHYFVSICR